MGLVYFLSSSFKFSAKSLDLCIDSIGKYLYVNNILHLFLLICDKLFVMNLKQK